MNFPKFWAKGEKEGFTCWRWSKESFAEAKRDADQAAAQLLQRWKLGALRIDSARHYGYGSGVLREESLEELSDNDGEPLAIVTRNASGALVLNTEKVMFVDIDFPEAKQKSGGFLGFIFGKPKQGKSPESEAVEAVLQKVRGWVKSNSAWSFRVYRTKAGMRLLSTGALARPDSPESKAAFQALGADPLYQNLCQRQKSFRARVSPKPWRCNSECPPERWPFINEFGQPNTKSEERYRAWLREYEHQSSTYAACRYLETIGSRDVHPVIQPVVTLHDTLSRSGTDFPLA